MVAIVSGNSLGLGQTSLATLGQHGLIGTAQHGRNGQAAFVNVATGNLVVQNHDDHLVAAGADVASVRTYNSRGPADDDNADNWAMSLARRPLEIAGAANAVGSTVTRTAADGAVAVYGFDANTETYVSHEGDGAHDTIQLAGGFYTWTDGSSGATETYEASPPRRLLQSLDATGKGFSYQYRDDGLLRSVTASNGERTLYGYSGNLLTEVRTESATGTVTGTRVRYAYDNARQLILRRSADRAQEIEYAYDAAGQVTRIEDTDRNKVTTYVYDLAGRRVREKLVQNRTTYQDNFLSYDAQGRLRDVADSRVHITMDYDGVGNRTRIATRVNYQGVTKEVTDSSVRYFQYDAMNRQTVVDGMDEEGNIGADQGHRITYDLNGNRTKDVSYRNRVATTENVIEGYDETGTVTYSGKSTTFKTSFGKSTETYQYDNLDRLTGVTRDGVQIDVRRYDGADRVIRSGPFKVLSGYAAALNEGVHPGEAHSQDVRINRYDDNGRILHQRIKSSDGKKLRTDISWDPTEHADDFEAYRANGYDEAGNVRSYVVRSYEGGGATEYKTKLAKFESYQTLTTSAKSTERDPGLVTHEYDANGFLVGVKDATQNDNNRVLVNDSEGRVLAARQEGHMRRQLIANGEVLGSYGVGVDPLEPSSGRNNKPNFANFADFNFGYAPVSASYPSAAPGAYQVQTGDSLQGIAQSAYGDSSLWYRIAEANGLSSSNDLRVGQTINIPNRVGTVSNNSTTFKPYDPSAMVGDTTPNMPMPSGAGGGCGGVGQLLMVVVAVAVSVYLGPIATSVLGSEVAGFAAAAAIGSAASQAVGVATGTIEKFQWKNVALAAISAGVTQGVGMQGGNAVVNGAIRSAVAQGIGVTTGLQEKFSWRAVAASAVGAGVGAEVGDALGGSDFGFGNFGNEVVARSLAAFTAGSVTSVLGGRGESIVQVAIDAFGNVVGGSIASASNAVPVAEDDPLGEFIDRNTTAWEQRQRNYDAFVGAFSQDGSSSRDLGVNVADAGSVLRLSRGTAADDEGYYTNLINMLQTRDAAQQAARVSYRAEQERATSALYSSGAGDVRLTSGLESPHGVDGHLDGSSETWPIPLNVVSEGDAGQTLFRRTEIEQMNAAGWPSFQESNDLRVLAGTYDRFGAISQAWSSSNLGDLWRHLTFEASPSARDSAIQRSFPLPHPDVVRIERMASSPIGTIAAGLGRILGADQSRQDALLATGSLLEQLGGTASQVYKQILTAPPPMPGSSARLRAAGQAARALPGITPETKRGVVQFGGLEVRAVRDLSHLNVSTLQAMQKYGFAAKDGAGNSLVLHHHRQNPAGPIIEVPASNHSIGRAAQHPFGNTKGSGLTPQQRAEFDQWRVDYWKWRATHELQSRGFQ